MKGTNGKNHDQHTMWAQKNTNFTLIEREHADCLRPFFMSMHAWSGCTKHQETIKTLSNLTGTLFASEGIGLKCGGSGTDRVSLFSVCLWFLVQCPFNQCNVCAFVCVRSFFFFLTTRKQDREGEIERGSEREGERDQKASELERHVLDRGTTLRP